MNFKKKYRVAAIVVAEIEIDSEADFKQKSIDWLDFHLPPDVSFAIHSIKKGKNGSNKIVGEFKPEDVFPYVTDNETFKEYVVQDISCGDISYKVRMNSLRYRTFLKNPACIACGITGNVFLLEVAHGASSAHFNFYCRDNGKLILMTKDHILPRSKGGPETLENMQTMCTFCNGLKDSHDFSLEQIKELKEAYVKVRRGITENEFRRQMAEMKKRLITENSKIIHGTVEPAFETITLLEKELVV